MKQNKIYKLICYLWILVPVLSLVSLSRPMLEIDMGKGVATAAALPGRTYNGFQLLIHVTLVNGYNATVADMRNFGFVVLKIMIALQLMFDVTIVFLCLREWRKKQSTMDFLRLRGMLSIGYVLTAVTIYRIAAEWSDHLEIKHDLFNSFLTRTSLTRTSYVFGEWGVYMTLKFSITIAILYVMTLLAFRLTSKKIGNE